MSDRDEIKLQLETVVDSTSLTSVIDMLSEIASEKASHIIETWQDKPLAKSWEKDSARLYNLARKIDN